MKSHEVIKKAVMKQGVKSVAGELGISTSLLYKWTQEFCDDGSDEYSGARNPLDRILKLTQCAGDRGIIEWLCRQSGGVFVENPRDIKPEQVCISVIVDTQTMIKEFSDLLHEVSSSLNDDQEISEKEARRIRREWEELKRRTESFVLCCEQGVFR